MGIFCYRAYPPSGQEAVLTKWQSSTRNSHEVAILNEEFRASAEEIEHARRVVTAYDKALAGAGRVWSRYLSASTDVSEPMRRPLFQGSCCRRGDESFSLTMVVSSGADHSLLSAGQRATGRVIYPEAGTRIVGRPSDTLFCRA